MRIGTLGQQNLEGGIGAVWRRQSKVSSQLLIVVAQKPPRRQGAGVGTLLAFARSDRISPGSGGYGLKIMMSTRIKYHADTKGFSHDARCLWGTFQRSAIS
jgi:hypothetical protein